jgi:hypothetical protein
MKNSALISVILASLALSGCIQSATEHLPDQRIAVVSDPGQNGKLVAIPKKCADWKRDIGDTLENQYFDHFGCAQNYNLAKMIVEPADLVRGRELSPADASLGVLSIERYRSDKKKELINPKEINSTTR